MGNNVSNVGGTKEVGGIKGSARLRNSWSGAVESRVGPGQFSPNGYFASVSPAGQTTSEKNLQILQNAPKSFFR